jgi:pilus assembly protein CpaB
MQSTASMTRSADRRVLFIALALGLVAAVLTIAYLRSAEARSRVTEPVIPTRPIVVAKSAIPAGQSIGLNMIEVRSVPSGIAAGDAATSVEEVIGQTARYPISPGEPITASRVVKAANGQALSFQIPPGMRAFTFPINANRSPAMLLVPGDFVDVLAVLAGGDLGVPLPSAATGDPRDAEGVATIIQNVQVLAVEANYVASGTPYDESVRGAPGKQAANDITLAVTPEEAQFLTLVVQRARFMTIALRPFADNTTQELAPATGPIRYGPDRPSLPQP